jgi:peptidyl-prolyl cis-trans isomerase SurA
MKTSSWLANAWLLAAFLVTASGLRVSLAQANAPEPRPIDRVVAIVNAEAITEREWTVRADALGKRLRAQGADLPAEPEFRRQVLERMVSDLAVQQAARDAGVKIDDGMIDRAVARIAQDSKLSLAQLRQQLEADGLTYAGFRQEIAREMVISRVRERDIDARVQVSEAEIDAYLADQKNAELEYNIAQILVRVPEGADELDVERARRRAETIMRGARTGVDFARIATSYSAAGERLEGGIIGFRSADRLPPVFVDAVAKLAPGDVAEVVRSPAGFHVLKLMERRGGGADQAAAPIRQTRARHILMRVNELNSEAEVTRRLLEIRERIQAGTVDFADMARQYSVDGSAQQGGDLGWVYPGDTVPEFERTMDELKPNELSEPVRSPFGYHLIQVVERRTDEATPERVRASARTTLRTRKSSEAFQEWSAQARDRAYVEYRLEDR